MRTLIAIAASAFGVAACSSNDPPPVDPETGETTAVTFAKSFGGPGYDTAIAAVPTSDRGYVFVGNLDAGLGLNDVGGLRTLDGDIWVVKLDDTGEVAWQRNLGDRAVSPGNGIKVTLTSPMRRTPDGGLIVGGTEYVRSSGAQLFHLVKLDPGGRVEWARSHASGGWLNYDYVPGDASEIRGAKDFNLRAVVPRRGGGYWALGDSQATVREPSGRFDGDDPYSRVPEGNTFIDAASRVVMRLNAEGDLLVSRRFTDAQFNNPGRALIRSDERGNALLVRHLGPYDDDLDEELREVSVLVDLLDSTARSIVSRRFARAEHLQRYPKVVDAVPTDDLGEGGRRDGVADNGFVVLYSDAREGTVLQKFSDDLVQQWQIDLTDTAAGLFQTVVQQCQPSVDVGWTCDYVIGGLAPRPNDSSEGGLLVRVSSNGQFIERRRLDEAAPQFTVVEALAADSQGRLTVLGGFDGPAGTANAGRRVAVGLDLQPIAGTAVTFDRRRPEYQMSPDGSWGAAFRAQLEPDGGFILSYLGAEFEGYLPHAFDASPIVLPPDLRGDANLLLRERVKGVAEISPGAFVVVGETQTIDTHRCTDCGATHAWLVRIDGGTITWQRTYAADALYSSVEGVAASGDGGFVVLAGSQVDDDGGGSQWRLVKFDARGSIQRQSPMLFDYDDYDDEREQVRAVPGGYLVTTLASTLATSVAFVDPELNVVWRRELTADPENPALPAGTIQSFDAVGDDGFVIALAYFNSTGFVHLMRLNRGGEPLWVQGYGSALGNASVGRVRVRTAPGGGFIVGLTTDKTIRAPPPAGEGVQRPAQEHNITLYKVSSTGHTEWQRTYGALYNEDLNSLETAADGGLLIGGSSSSIVDTGEAWILRTGPDGLVNEGCNADLGELDAPPLFRVTTSPAGSVVVASPPADVAAPRLLSELNWNARTEEMTSTRQCRGHANLLLPPPPAGQFRLSVVQAGPRSGAVTSAPQGIACGTGLGDQFCSADFPAGTQVVLTADTTGFERWDTTLCAPGRRPNVCGVTLDGDVEIPVVFAGPRGFFLTVAMPGAAPSARIVSDPAGIDCTNASGSDCIGAYEPGTVVRLRASGSEFVSWQGCAPVADEARACDVTMDADRRVEATL